MATKAARSSNDIHVALTTHPDANKGPKTLQQALGLAITDKASHAAVRAFGKEIKEKIAEIEAYYRTKANGTGIIDPLYKAYKAALATMTAHLAPFVEADRVIQGIDTAYVREQRRIEEQAAEDARLKAEAEEVKRRQKEADRAEAEALKLEAASENLSAREQAFVLAFIGCDNALKAATRAGYKNPGDTGYRLLDQAKILKAIEGQRRAIAVRQESEAKQAEPINVEVVTKASEIVDGGLRTYYGCGEVNLVQLCRDALKAYDGGDPSKIMGLQPDLVFLNLQARQLQESFSFVWPACKLAKRDGTVGR